MQHKHIITSLPLLASILGRKYGVEVRIGGDSAYTNGNIIQLPGLPLECDATLIGLLRGYIDHESAHIRHTDFTVLKRANLSDLEKHIWNILEDWRVENALARLYPGCRQNFIWLIRHFFLDEQNEENKSLVQPAEDIMSWLLITVRMWDEPQLAAEQQRLQARIDTNYPGLILQLEPVMERVQAKSTSTHDTLQYAHEIISLLNQYVDEQERLQEGTSTQSGGMIPEEILSCSHEASQDLHNLLIAGSGEYPVTMGERLEHILSSQVSSQQDPLCVAVPVAKQCSSFSTEEIKHCRQATTALRTRLQAFLQSTKSIRNRSAYTGKLNSHKVHTLATGNTKVFLRYDARQQLNTAVHILLDSSGSMIGKAMELANQACFSVASALQGIKGIQLGVTSFPGGKLAGENAYPEGTWNTVTPLLHHNQSMHTDFNMTAAGDTPMDAALLWVLQQLYPLPEKRKMILLITDGSPNDFSTAEKAIAMVKQQGIEIYGVGIADASIAYLLPGNESIVIQSMGDLAPAMFSMLQKALINS